MCLRGRSRYQGKQAGLVFPSMFSYLDNLLCQSLMATCPYVLRQKIIVRTFKRFKIAPLEPFYFSL